MTTIKSYLKYNRWFLSASFFLPFFILAILYLTIGIYPGSSRSILASDAFAQFSNFHASYRNMLIGKQSIFYTWNASLGLNYLSLISYYLGGFFTPLVLFFPNQAMPDALYFLTLLKIGSAGLAFWLFANHTFKIDRLKQLILAVCYALMSFAIAHSEIIMWLDTFTFLPLIIWGIHRIIDQKKARLLFFSYVGLFISNFYMGFMVAVFSGLYYLIRLVTRYQTVKTSLIPYARTSILATGASMITILPTLIDLRTNGEELTKITSYKTEATGFFDFFLKNMIGVYDTTKYGSIPFIYIGLLPLTLFVFYFLSKTIHSKEKIGFALLAGLLIGSFYFQPFNLFWQGMHAPNMFLFRYAFLLSFLVILLAGYAWEQLDTAAIPTYLTGIILLIIGFTLTYGLIDHKKTAYLTPLSFILTLVFLLLYFLCIAAYHFQLFKPKHLTWLLLIGVVSEMTLNTNFMIRGILADWNYASRSLYTDPYPKINQLVTTTKTKNNTFYRLENLNEVSPNDSINYGYSGINMFSSIRNRHSSSYLNDLGFRSSGTNLNIRYASNTLLMDALMGIKYNISTTPVNKYGFNQIETSGNYSLFENQSALPLAFLADNDSSTVTRSETDNLKNQTTLVNYLATVHQTYFQLHPVETIATNNTSVTAFGNQVTYTEMKPNLAKDITWRATIPAKTQAYLSLFPTDTGVLKSSTVTLTVNGSQRKTQLNISGQYYDLGYYDTPTTLEFSGSFYGSKQVTFQTPKLVTLDTTAYQTAIDAIKQQKVAFTPTKRGASATIQVKEKQTLVTTIPYDQGWTAKVDGKKVPIRAFKDAFIQLHLTKGTHQVVFSYLPKGFILGSCCFILSLLFFFFFERNPRLNERKQTH